MGAETGTWHYGLIARYWAEFNTAEPDELAYCRGAIEQFGQPALDLACGTGRLLLPLIAAGFDVDGVDMLEVAGFADVSVEGRYNGQPATADDGTVVFIATN